MARKKPPAVIPSGKILYRESFEKGPGAWCSGKDREDGAWHRNIMGQRGHPEPAGWKPKGGRNGGCAFSESPWYFDDNHGELCWLYLAFFVNRSSDAGLQGKDFRNASVHLTLRGNGLRLQGTRLQFWIQGMAGPDSMYQKPTVYNWMLTSQPIIDELTDGKWHDREIVLPGDESKWSQMGLLNGGLARRIQVVQSTSVADESLDKILGGTHVNFGFLLCNVDPNDPPTGRIEFDQVSIQTG